MRCCTGLLLLATLALSSASVQDVMKRRSARFRRVVDEQTLLFGGISNLEWKDFSGSVPNGAVSIYNHHTRRTDYVCKRWCEAGFYSSSLGPYCHYPYGDREHKATEFQILVNKDNFELLEWKDGSYGSVPQNSIRTCPNENKYVGKNKYGLGKVITMHEAFFLPWEGKEYWYKTYKVLTINKDTFTQDVTDVRYIFDQAAKLQNNPHTMQTMITTNNGCQTTTKTVELNQQTTTQTTWSIGQAFKLGVRNTFTARVPIIAEATFELGLESTTDFRKDATKVEHISHKLTTSLKVPPNHSCSVQMVGRQFQTDIPYTARLSRTYANGQTHSTSITGTYSQVSVGEVHTVLGRCEPVPNATPCQ